MGNKRKTYSDFGWVRRDRKGKETDYLFVWDKPKNLVEKEDPRIKTSGGNNKKNEDPLIFLPRKMREETGLSFVFVGVERDYLGRRKPLIEIEVEEGHFLRIWEMKVSDSDLNKNPIRGKNIKDVRFLIAEQIIKARNDKKILDYHSLVVDKEIMSKNKNENPAL